MSKQTSIKCLQSIQNNTSRFTVKNRYKTAAKIKKKFQNLNNDFPNVQEPHNDQITFENNFRITRATHPTDSSVVLFVHKHDSAFAFGKYVCFESILHNFSNSDFENGPAFAEGDHLRMCIRRKFTIRSKCDKYLNSPHLTFGVKRAKFKFDTYVFFLFFFLTWYESDLCFFDTFQFL